MIEPSVFPLLLKEKDILLCFLFTKKEKHPLLRHNERRVSANFWPPCSAETCSVKVTDKFISG